MDDVKTYTLETIDAAIDKVAKEHLGSLAVISKADLITELRRPKVEFSVGQVVYAEYFDDDQPTGDYFQIEAEDMGKALTNCRPLTLTEHGKAVSDLVKAMERVKSGDVGQGGFISVYSDFADKALVAFNAATGG